MANHEPVEGEIPADERAPLLPKSSDFEGQAPRRLAYRLYLSHTLSTWNSRVFEFGAVLYLATIYPGTLTAMSVYAFARGICAVVFASAVGLYIDTGNRLQVVRVSILVQRLVVALSCVAFYALLTRPMLPEDGRTGMFVGLIILACIEKLCSIMNLVSVEKDWCVVVAQGDQTALRRLNAQMRRIDLLCKLLGPLFIALIDGSSTRIAIIVNFAMNIASVPVEYIAIARVYREVPELQKPKHTHTTNEDGIETRNAPNLLQRMLYPLQKSITDFILYVRHRAFLPSFAGALLYLTVLNFGGQMVTFLLASGYKSSIIGIARTLSVACEVSATWIGPWLMSKIGPIRAGLWLSICQLTPLIAGTACYFALHQYPVYAASALVAGTIVSRIGLRGFDLSTQLIVQEDVEADSRGAFSAVEAAWQNALELLSYAITIVFSVPSQFQIPVVISTSAVGLATCLYIIFVFRRRGHLIHIDKFSKLISTIGSNCRRDLSS